MERVVANSVTVLTVMCSPGTLKINDIEFFHGYVKFNLDGGLTLIGFRVNFISWVIKLPFLFELRLKYRIYMGIE